jgi:asparagine synthase (glutamine-hydrolysing)
MCGVNGVFWYRGGVADAALVRAQAHAQRHRGPDDADVWAEGPVALGHRRLSVVDLSPGGHQPMANEDSTVHVVFNGELYNWPEIMPLLAARGHRFRGRSDTEMLLHLWEEKREGLLADLRGMFAFALHDANTRTLMLARDRVGKKPLYWHDNGQRIVFASELKSLLVDPSVPREPDPAAIADFLTFQYVPSPGSILAGVHKLSAGHYLLCDEAGPRVARYWELPLETDCSLSAEDAVAGLGMRLADAVRVRLMSDVPLGAFLSGGIDSSAVVALMSQASSTRVKTYSIGFEDADLSELAHARTVAEHLGTDHHELIVRPNALDLLPRLVWGLDEPFADASMVPTFHVAEMARSHVTVALSGDGGDEAFAGYTTYDWARSYARIDAMPAALRKLAALPAGWLPADHPLGRRLRRSAMTPVERHLEVMAHFPPRELRAVFSPALRAAIGAHDPWASARALHARAARGLGALAALPALDALTYLTDDVLVKVDRTSMMSSLETRAPLLDHHVLEFVARMPFEYKLRGDVTKWVLRECVRPLLPPAIMARGKQGFGVPLGRWFAGDFGRLAREVLLDRRARTRGWLDPGEVERLLEGQGMRDELRSKRVYTLVCLELWAQCYLDRPRSALAAPTDGPYPLHSAVSATVMD